MATGALVAFTAVSAGAQIVKGIQANSAMSNQGVAYLQQAEIAKQESELEAAQKQREVDKFAARQVMAFAKNGIVTDSESPLAVLHETVTLGTQEVNAIRNRGIAQAQMYTTTANNAFSSGRASLFGGVADSLTTVGASLFGAAKGNLFSNSSTVGSGLSGWEPSFFNSGSGLKGYSGTLPSLNGGGL